MRAMITCPLMAEEGAMAVTAHTIRGVSGTVIRTSLAMMVETEVKEASTGKKE